MAFCIYVCAVLVLIMGRNKYSKGESLRRLVSCSANKTVTRPPQGSIVPRAAHALWIGFKSRRVMDHAKPSYQIQQTGTSNVSWDDQFIDELKVALTACRVL